MTIYLTQLSAGATAIGVSPTDVTNQQALLHTWATNMSTAAFTSSTDLDNQVAALLAAVPVAMLAF